MHYFCNKFAKIAKHWGSLHPGLPFIFDFGELKLRDLAKIWFFKLIMTKLNLKNQL